jgi:signal transduction histidine kinase
LLRATQEALTNVRKHSGARHVDVRLRFDSEMTELEVRDDGRGFDPSGAGGFGLPGMKTRVAHIGGYVDIESAPGRGTVVRVKLP